MMKQIVDTKDFYQTLEQHDKVLVYWYTKWCPDCFAIKPYLPRLENEFPNLTFVQMDRDDDIELAKHLEIYGIPSFIIFRGEDELARLVNKDRKTYAEVKTFIESVL